MMNFGEYGSQQLLSLVRTGAGLWRVKHGANSFELFIHFW